MEQQYEHAYEVTLDRAARSRKWRPRIRTIYRILLISGLIAAVIYSTLFFTGGGYGHARDKVMLWWMRSTHSQGFTLKQLDITGYRHVPKEVILQQLFNTTQEVEIIGSPLLQWQPDTMEKQLKALGWVREAMIRRQYPDTLIIHVKEKIPYAIWQQGELYSLIDDEGKIIHTSTELSEFVSYKDLPVIVGTSANTQLEQLFFFITQDEQIFYGIESIQWIGKRRWNVNFYHGMTIYLPEKQPEKAWQRIVELHQEKQLLDRKIAVIDMRLPGRIAMLPDL